MREFDAQSFYQINQVTEEERAYSVSWVLEKGIRASVKFGDDEHVVLVVAFLNPKTQPDLHQTGSESRAFVLTYGKGTATSLFLVKDYAVIPNASTGTKTSFSVSHGNFENCLRFDFEGQSNFNNDLVYFSHDLSGSEVYGQVNGFDGEHYRCRVLALLLPAYRQYGRSGIRDKEQLKLLGLTYSLEKPGKVLLRRVFLEV